MSADELNLYFVRHGETEGNVNRDLYITNADHAIRLTENGIQQAGDAGVFLADHLSTIYEADPQNFGRVRVWHSPYYRARETAAYILGPLQKKFDNKSGQLTYREDPFLFEQKAGLYDGLKKTEYAGAYPAEARDYDKHVASNGRAYAKSPQGESQIDIVIRTKHFFGTLLDDYKKSGIKHDIVINHGVTVRAMTMGWMRYVPEWLDAEKNPGNCWIRHIHGNRATGYKDEGYIHGQGAPLRDVMATQIQLPNPEKIYMLNPGRSNGIVPRGVIPVDPFAPKL